MTVLAAVVVIAVSVSCSPSSITMAEAKALAIHAARASGVPNRFHLDAKEGDDDPSSYTFRVFATNPDPGTSSNLAGWFAVNKATAALTNPVLDDRPIRLSAVRSEQVRLRGLHCQP